MPPKADNAAAAALLADAEHKKLVREAEKETIRFLISEREKSDKILRPPQALCSRTAGDPRGGRPDGRRVLAVVRSRLYLDFRFLDMALSALAPYRTNGAACWPQTVVNLFYQPSALLRLYQENPKYLNRLYLHTIFHCVFRHFWLKGRRGARLWGLACDIAVENVIDSLNRSSVKRPLTYVRQNAYQQITAEANVVAAAPVYRWLTRQTPGVLRQLGGSS